MFSTSQWAEYCHGFVGCTYLYRINSFRPNDCAAQASSGSKEQPNCSRFPCNLETAHIRPMQSVVAAISAATFDSQPTHMCFGKDHNSSPHYTQVKIVGFLVARRPGPQLVERSSRWRLKAGIRWSSPGSHMVPRYLSLAAPGSRVAGYPL